MKGLMKASYSGPAMWRGSRGIGSPLEYNVGECAVSRSVGKLWKRWINIVKECLKKRGLEVRHARRTVQDRREWRGFAKGNAWV